MPSATEQKIIGAAVRLFASQGYDATSVQEIVTAAEVTKGALYHYFRAKDDLLFEIYRLLITSQAADLDRIIGLGLSAAETVREIMASASSSRRRNASTRPPCSCARCTASARSG